MACSGEGKSRLQIAAAEGQINLKEGAGMAVEGDAVAEHEEVQKQEISAAEDWDAPGEPQDLSSLSAQTEWLNSQQPMVR